MPRFDGTGPRGMGPMTGGGRGYCAVPLNASLTETEHLKQQIQALQAQLAQITAAIESLRNEAVATNKKNNT